MRKILLSMAIMATVMGGARAEDRDATRDYYVGFRVAPSNMAMRMEHQSTHANPVALGFMIGHQFNKNVRMDFEVDHMGGENRDGFARASASTAMANIYWNSGRTDTGMPMLYFGVGMGISSLDFNLDGVGRAENNTAFAYQVAMGLDIELNDRLGADIGIRFRSLGDVMHEFGNSNRHWTDFYVRQLYAGMKFKF